MRELSEDDFDTFDGWLKCQNFATIAPEQMELLRKAYDEARQHTRAMPKLGRRMNLGLSKPGELRYAVAIRKGGLWLTLWVRRWPKGAFFEYFVLIPRLDREWDPHTSYHHTGRLHAKSFGYVFGVRTCQHLTREFKGSVHLGKYGGMAQPPG